MGMLQPADETPNHDEPQMSRIEKKLSDF